MSSSTADIITEFIAKEVRAFQVRLTAQVLTLFNGEDEKVTPAMARALIKASDAVAKKAEKAQKAKEKRELKKAEKAASAEPKTKKTKTKETKTKETKTKETKPKETKTKETKAKAKEAEPLEEKEEAVVEPPAPVAKESKTKESKTKESKTKESTKEPKTKESTKPAQAPVEESEVDEDSGAAELAQRLADAEDKLKKASKDVPKVVKPKESTKESTKEPKTKEPKTKEPKSPKTKESIPPVTKTVTVASTEEDVFAGVVVPGAAELDAHEARPYTASDAVVFKHGKKTYMKMPTGALFKMGETKGELGEAAGYWDEASSSIVQEEPFGSV
jgi:chemotaxis protein histidine kinase CheA